MPKICRTLRRNDGTPYTTCFEPSGAIRGRAARLPNDSTPARPPAYTRGDQPPSYSIGSPPQYTDDRGAAPAYRPPASARAVAADAARGGDRAALARIGKAARKQKGKNVALAAAAVAANKTMGKAKKGTHKMPDGTLMTGKTHTKDSKPVAGGDVKHEDLPALQNNLFNKYLKAIDRSKAGRATAEDNAIFESLKTKAGKAKMKRAEKAWNKIADAHDAGKPAKPARSEARGPLGSDLVSIAAPPFAAAGGKAPKKPAPKKAKTASATPTDRLSVIKSELDTLSKKMVKDMKDRVKIIPSLTEKDYRVVGDQANLRFESAFGDQSMIDQKKAQDLQKEWAKLKGIGDDDLQAFMGKFNRQMKLHVGKVQRAERGKKQQLADAIFERNRAKPKKPTKAEAQAAFSALKRGQRAFVAWMSNNEAQGQWINNNSEEFKRMIGQ